jgi:hypothetical protein
MNQYYILTNRVFGIMVNIHENTYGSVTVIEHSDYKWGVVNAEGNEIVPFGKYNWIDAFESGLARVKIGTAPSNMKDNGNKWGIINEKGKEVVPVEYDCIWNFAGKNRFSTKIIKDGIESDVYFHELNPELPQRGTYYQENDDARWEEEDYGSHYGKYAGSYAQDVEGYSDDVIDDAFEGDPDAYWNID